MLFTGAPSSTHSADPQDPSTLLPEQVLALLGWEPPFTPPPRCRGRSWPRRRSSSRQASCLVGVGALNEPRQVVAELEALSKK